MAIVKPKMGPTTNQGTRTILNWLLDKGTEVKREDDIDTVIEFKGNLPHRVVGEIVNLYHDQGQHKDRAVRYCLPPHNWTYYDYSFVWKNRWFQITIRKNRYRKTEKKYFVRMESGVLSVEALMNFYETKSK